jgi:outer membrane protein OmpA-like peptidoglycan-associated protein
MLRQTVLASLILLCATAATAQSAVHYRPGDTVDPQEVARVLGGAGAAPIKTRSIRLLADAGAALPGRAKPAAVEVVVDTAGAPDLVPEALSLPVQFSFGSADILPAAREQLDALAAGIQLLPPQRRLVVEGHTDAAGSDGFNQVLSLRRAEAVKAYLVHRHGIAAARLKVEGHGESRPIDALDALAPENRRVQFRGG